MKKPYESKTILFFSLLIIYAFSGAAVEAASNNEIVWANVDWTALVSGIMGIVLRFISTKPVNLK